MISTLAKPTNSVPKLVIVLDVVSVAFTLSKIRKTPSLNISLSFSMAWKPLITLMPPRASVSLPVTSARISPRRRKAGRSALNALVDASPNRRSGPRARVVMITSIRTRKMKATIAVIVPPTNCTSPVPTRFLTPSTSSIMRDTNSPVLESLKVRIGNWRTCF